MYDKQLWLAMAAKLEEIAENTVDMDTKEELDELIGKIYESV